MVETFDLREASSSSFGGRCKGKAKVPPVAKAERETWHKTPQSGRMIIVRCDRVL